MKETENIIGIYHSRDLDGYTSGAIIKLKYPNAKLIGYDYGQPFEIEPQDIGKPIIMADVSMPMLTMKKLAELSNWQFTWIDHHRSAINDYNQFVGNGESFCIAVLEDGISACEGTWKYLFPDKRMPDAIKFLGEYDTWRKAEVGEWSWNNEVLAFQFGMRLICNSPETFPPALLADWEEDSDEHNDLMVQIINDGITILKYQAQVNEQLCKATFEYEFEGLRCICLNGGGFNSDVFKSVYDENKHDAMMPFKYDGKINQWVFSLYGTKDIDLSVIAKKYGGGGHAKACGFQITNINDIFTHIK